MASPSVSQISVKVPTAQGNFTPSHFMSHIFFELLSLFALHIIKVRSMLWVNVVQSTAHMSLYFPCSQILFYWSGCSDAICRKCSIHLWYYEIKILPKNVNVRQGFFGDKLFAPNDRVIYLAIKLLCIMSYYGQSIIITI